MQDWLLDALIWCAETGLLRPDMPVVVPTRTWFTAPGGTDREATARALLADILRIVGLEDADIALIPIETLPDELRHEYGRTSEIAGTWQQAEEGGSIIRYDPTLVRSPTVFLSVLAHEVMHDRLSRTARDWPGGAEAEELVTDLAVIASGMGVLQLAGAEDAGWQGYMRQDSRAHATALSLLATGGDAGEAMAHLPARAARALRAALRHLDGGEDVAELRAALRR